MPFLTNVSLSSDAPEDSDEYPLGIPAIRDLRETMLRFHPKCTFLVGENGSGKSTLLEGIADRWGYSREGGSRTRNLYAQELWSDLGPMLYLNRKPGCNPMDGFFLRAESFFNFATMLDEFEEDIDTADGYFSYGGKSLHAQSHGESFLTLFKMRFHGDGVYILDEPEAALSPQRQLAFLVRMNDLIKDNSQFIIATHSPILLGYPDATIYELDEFGIKEIAYEQSQPYQITSRFLKDRERMLDYLLNDDDEEDL